IAHHVRAAGGIDSRAVTFWIIVFGDRHLIRLPLVCLFRIGHAALDVLYAHVLAGRLLNVIDDRFADGVKKFFCCDLQLYIYFHTVLLLSVSALRVDLSCRMAIASAMSSTVC